MYYPLVHIGDYLLLLLYISIVFIAVNFIRGYSTEKKPEYKYFHIAAFLKLLGAISFAMVYVYYYQGGDTLYYFIGGAQLQEYLFKDPSTYFKLLSSSTDFNYDLAFIKNEIAYARSSEEWFMVKIMSIINLIGFNRYLLSSVVISMLSLWGSWRMFQALIILSPKHKKVAFYSVFLIPSVIFWGSGILKDTISFSFLGIFFYYSIRIFFQYKFNLVNFIMLSISFLVIFNMKAYIILSFLPVVLLGWVVNNRAKIQSQFFKNLLTPILLVAIVVMGVLIIPNMAKQSDKYKIDNLESRLKGFHSWHTTVGGSSYDLHVEDYKPLTIVSKIPAALNVTFYRPYITEVRNITMAIGGIESLIFLILSIFILIRFRLKILSVIYKNPILLMSVLYAIIFGFAVGFTSYNFGALARYKIPVMPFFSYILFYFYYEHKKMKKMKDFNL